jgi:hypothetical protein
MSNCPKCNQETVIMIYGNHWDYDTEYCTSRECDYEADLKTMTCYEEDGSIVVINLAEDDDED